MSINSFLHFISLLIFPITKNSSFFEKWKIEDYKKLLPPAKITDKNSMSLFSYKNVLTKKLIHSIKKEKVYFIGEAISELMSEEILSLFENSAFISEEEMFVVPIPIGRKRMQERGFNQSAWIAKMVCDRLGEKFKYSPFLLKKIKDTKKQALLHRTERLQNPRGSFRAYNVPKKSTIFLVDDVITTGATTNEAKKELLHAGAKKVIVISIAR